MQTEMTDELRRAFIEVYSKEVTQQKIDELDEKLLDRKSIESKIQFLEDELIYYKINMSHELVWLSAVCNYPNFPLGTPLFWDRILRLKIDYLKTQL
jgi:hypothetical protein